MTLNFDQWIDRSHSDSVKWNKYKNRDVIPLWVADTDFTSPPEVITSLQQRVAEGVFGYGFTPPELTQLIVKRMAERYQWIIQPEWLVWQPTVMGGINMAIKAYTTLQESCILPIPVYPPFIDAAQAEGRTMRPVTVEKRQQRWVVDFSAAEKTFDGTEKLLMLCNPYNPGGTVFRREELLAQLDMAQRHNLIVCSDEIHCDLLLELGLQHIPFAALSEDAAQRSITLMSPSKTFNLAGLCVSFAIIPNAELRQKFNKASKGVTSQVNILAYAAATAAYRDGDPWLQKQLVYLRDNRDLATARINAMPGLHMLPIEGTYLGWIDASQLPVDDPYRFFVNAGVGFTPGRDFGYPQFVRINLGCQRALLLKALSRMEAALQTLNI